MEIKRKEPFSEPKIILGLPISEEEIYKVFKDPYLIDIISLPLDVVAQERGYIRRSPIL
jgi:hypothetical protein